MRLFGEVDKRELDQVFVELSINEDYDRRPNQAEFLGLMDSELRRMRSVFGDTEQFRDDSDDPTQRHLAKPKRTIKPDELLHRHTHAVITGAPGCGKTTLLRYLAWQTLKQWQAFRVLPSGGEVSQGTTPPEGGTLNARFPVFLELKQLTATDFQQGSLEDLLFRKAVAAIVKPRDDTERDTLQQRFRTLLEQGRVAVFLDGLDEVSGAKFFGELQTAVSEFLQSAYGNNTVIISTRPFALRQFDDAKMMEIQPLTPRQIEQFIEHYYRDVPERQQFQRELQRRRELRELARVPALLGFILQLWRKRGSVTDDKLELYEQITLELAQQLDSEKEGVKPDREWRVEDKSGLLKRDFLRQLAFNRMFQGIAEKPYDLEHKISDTDRLVFDSDTLIAEAERFAAARYQQTGKTLDPYDLAEDVKATSLLRQVGTDHYAFAHLTLQEYLAAWQLAKRHDADTCERIFCRAYFNLTLAEMEVLPMTLGLVGEPDKFYEALEQLPESLDFKGLRLRACGLGYDPRISESVFDRLIDRLIDFISFWRLDQIPYRVAVVESFSRLSEVATERLLVKVFPILKLDDDDGYWRSDAVEMLEKIGGEFSIPTLLTILKSDENINVRRSAATALARIGNEQSMAALFNLLTGDENARAIAVEALGEIGGNQAEEALLRLLKDENWGLRGGAVGGLGEIHSEQAIRALLEALNDENAYVQMRAIIALQGIFDENVKTGLIEALSHENDMVRWCAARALGYFNETDVTDVLLECWKSTDYALHQGAISALSKIGDTRLANIFLEALQDENRDVRHCAVEALGRIGGESAIALLLKSLKDEESFVRVGAVEALERIGISCAMETFGSVLSDEDGAVRVAAAKALATVNYDLATKTLRNLLKDKDDYVRICAVEALGDVGHEQSVAGLLEALNDDFGEVLDAAAKTLANVLPQYLTSGLLYALRCTNSFVRHKSSEVIGYYSSYQQILQELSDLAMSDTSEEVRQIAQEAWRKFEYKLQYFDIPISTTTTNDPTPPNPPLPLTAQKRAELE